MTLTIEITDEEGARLKETAQLQGKPVSELLHDFVRTLSTSAERELRTSEPVDSRTWGARTMDDLIARGAVGIWQDRPESSSELAAEFQRLAQTPGALRTSGENQAPR